MKTWHRNLGEFIRLLEQNGELRVVDRPVSVDLEISRMVDAESKLPGGGQALLFSQVKESPFPVAANLFGSLRRVCLGLGVTHLDYLADRVRLLTESPPPKGPKDLLRLAPAALSVARSFPRRLRLKQPPCQEVVQTGNAVDLTQLPVIKCWPGDAGRFVTLPLVVTRSLDGRRRNVGMYRLQVFNRNTTGMHWHIHKDGAHFYQEYLRAGKRMPVAAAIGADPAVTYAATAPLPRNIDELILAGFIRNKPVPLARCLTVPLEVPAEAEFVLEGYVDPGELRREGPFGDHTGYYSLADDYPVFHVTALTRRQNPVYQTTLVGRPPMEDGYLGLATERLFLPLLRTQFPEIVDYRLPWEGVFHNCVLVALDKSYPGQAQKIMHGLWGQGQMSFTKSIVVLDRNQDLSDSAGIVRVLLETLDPASDLTFAKGLLDMLDHATPTPGMGGKIGLDLTRRLPGEPPRAGRFPLKPLGEANRWDLPTLAREILPDVDDVRPYPLSDRPLPNRVLLLSVDKGSRSGVEMAEPFFQSHKLDMFNIFILFDRPVDLDDHPYVMWRLFNNVEIARDIRIDRGRIVIDACRKGPADRHMLPWPDELTFAPKEP